MQGIYCGKKKSVFNEKARSITGEQVEVCLHSEQLADACKEQVDVQLCAHAVKLALGLADDVVDEQRHDKVPGVHVDVSAVHQQLHLLPQDVGSGHGCERVHCR